MGDRVPQLQPIIEGNPGGHTLFFLQGWPDDARLWDDQVAALSSEFRCVRVDLPNFGIGERCRWGYRTPQIVEGIANCIQDVSPDAPVTLIAHDWGAYWGHMLHNRHPERIARLVALDVAPHYRPTLGAVLGLMAYQFWLWAAFVLDGAVGNWMTRWMARRANAPRQDGEVDSSMNYPYRNAWLDVFSGYGDRETKDYWPKVPLLFAYGARKPFHFHSQNWIDYVKGLPGGQVVALDSDHWVMRAPEFTAMLCEFLRSTPPTAVQPPSHAG